jgi:hypothetical protein
MKAKVAVSTFSPGNSSGAVIELGTFNMEVQRGPEQMTRRFGCCSTELWEDPDVPTVVIGGRKLVLGIPWGPLVGFVDYTLAITPELASVWKVCPHCGEPI